MSPAGNVAREFALESWHHVVELKGVSSEVNPSRLLSENAKSVSRPETVSLVPASNIWLSHFHVSVKAINVEFPSGGSSLVLKILSENRGPLLAGNIIIDVLGGLRNFHFTNRHVLSNFNIRFKFLIRLIIPVVKRSSLKVNDSSASIHVINSGSESNLSSEPMASKSSHSQFLLVHEPDDISRNFFHSEAFVMVRLSHVSNIN